MMQEFDKLRARGPLLDALLPESWALSEVMALLTAIAVIFLAIPHPLMLIPALTCMLGVLVLLGAMVIIPAWRRSHNTYDWALSLGSLMAGAVALAEVLWR
jgi:hypothetical protein